MSYRKQGQMSHSPLKLETSMRFFRMRNMMNTVRIGLTVGLAAILFTVAGPVLGQADTRNSVLQLNKQAMEKYANLQIDKAMRLLKKAEGICKKKNVSKKVLAGTYVNMGVIEAGGNMNNGAAAKYFKEALCLDSSILLNPLDATPELETIFNMSRSQAAAECPASGASSSSIQPLPRSHQPPPQSSSVLRHQPVVEQQRLMPVPLFIQVNPQVEVGLIILYYRTLGERIFQQVPMEPFQDGYAVTIGCEVMQTFDPSAIEYYIAIMDFENQLLGTSGTEAQPHHVTIVQELSGPPPILPGMGPPEKCMEECPPWNPECNKSCKQMGDLCDNSSECCEGMVCKKETCTGGDKKGGGGGADAIFRVNVTFGSGVGIIPADAFYPYNQIAFTPQHILDDFDNEYVNDNVPDGRIVNDTGLAWSKFHFRVNPMFYLPKGFLVGVTFRGGLALAADPASDVMPLAPTVLAVAAYRLVGGSKADVFELDVTLGIGGGVVLHRIPYEDCKPYWLYPDDEWFDSTRPEEDQRGCLQIQRTSAGKLSNNGAMDWTTGAWDGYYDREQRTFFRQAGKFVVELGFDSYIWFVNSFGLNIGLDGVLYAGDNLAINIDVQLGPAFRF